MKKIIVLLMSLSIMFAGEFYVKSFNKINNDLSARKYVKHDINGEACALLKVRTDLEVPLQFDSNMGIPYAPEQKDPGEYWIYLAPGERALKCMADGFIPKTISLESHGKIESLTVYELQLSSKEKNIKTLPVTILSIPGNAEKWIDGTLLGKEDNYKIAVGKHELKLVKKGYKPYVQEIVVDIDHVLFKDIVLTEIEALAVQITSTPTKADLYINEEYRGKSNLGLFLVPGKYDIAISKPGYSTLKKVMRVKEGEFNGFHFNLEKNVGRLYLTILPTDAKISIDNQQQSILPSYELAPGLHKIMISKKGYSSVNETIEIKKGDQISKNIVLEQKTGSLQMTVQPLDASVSLKTSEDVVYQYWKGLKHLKDIPIGDYTMEVSREGYESQSRQFAVNENKKTLMNISLIDLNADPDDTNEEMPYIAPTPYYDSAEYPLSKKEKKVSKYSIGGELGITNIGLKGSVQLAKTSSVNLYVCMRAVGGGLMLAYEGNTNSEKTITLHYGAGVHAGYAFIPIPGFTIENDVALGASAIVGMKYSLEKMLDMPIKIGLQYQPGYDLIGKWMGSWMDVNLIVELGL